MNAVVAVPRQGACPLTGVAPHPPCLFAPGAGQRFGAAVASLLGTPLAALEERDFEDGEHKLRPLESVRERDVYLVQSLYRDARQSPNDKLVRVLWLAGALRDAGAARVTLVAPYLCYARKDRRSQTRDPVSLRYLAEVLEAVGVQRVLTCDVHNLAAFQNAFRVPAEDLSATSLFTPVLAELAGARAVTVVSPDAGGALRAEALRLRLARALGRPVARALMEKRRSGGVVSGDHLAGEVAGRVAVLVDDLISTGTTLDRAARACRALGASAVYACATHGLFSADAAAVLAAMPIDGLLVTDTVGGVELPKALDMQVRYLSAAPLVAAAIRRLHEGRSLSELLA